MRSRELQAERIQPHIQTKGLFEKLAWRALNSAGRHLVAAPAPSSAATKESLLYSALAATTGPYSAQSVGYNQTRLASSDLINNNIEQIGSSLASLNANSAHHCFTRANFEPNWKQTRPNAEQEPTLASKEASERAEGVKGDQNCPRA